MYFKRESILALLLVSLSALLVACGESNESPVVNIISPSAGQTQGSTVQFEIEYSDPDGEIESIAWDFGDGNASDEANPEHTYQSSNDYSVSVTVTDSDGATARDSITVDVEVGPRAIATVGRIDSGGEPVVIQFIEDEAPLQVEFDALRSRASPGSEIASYHWDFGTGDESNEPNPQYVYRQPGEYQAILTVTDEQSRSSQARVTVRVIAYEPSEATLELPDGAVSYDLISRNSRSSSTGLSMFFQYVVDSNRVLTREEVDQIVSDIVTQAQKRPRVSRITVQFFTEEKSEMMIPREYSHYIGSAVWARDAEDQSISTNLNNAYFDGTGIEVYGFTIRETLLAAGDPDCGLICSQFRIGIADIFIQAENVCRETLDQTIEEIVQWRLSSTYQGYLAAVYHSQDLGDPIAWISGVRPDTLPLQDLPYQLFTETPPGWNTPKDTNWRVNFANGLSRC